jgi:hypothetical protein
VNFDEKAKSLSIVEEDVRDSTHDQVVIEETRTPGDQNIVSGKNSTIQKSANIVSVKQSSDSLPRTDTFNPF